MRESCSGRCPSRVASYHARYWSGGRLPSDVSHSISIPRSDTSCNEHPDPYCLFRSLVQLRNPWGVQAIFRLTLWLDPGRLVPCSQLAFGIYEEAPLV